VLEDEGHFCGVHQLLPGFVFYRDALGPEFDGFSVGDFEQLVRMFLHVLSTFLLAGESTQRMNLTIRRIEKSNTEFLTPLA
jgi:hypothetical protein